MAAVKYTKAKWVAQADIQQLKNGQFQGVVLLSYENGNISDDTQHTVATASDSAGEALDEAKALAHRLLADLEQ